MTLEGVEFWVRLVAELSVVYFVVRAQLEGTK